MQTTQYLTHEELKFLDALRNGERTSVKAGYPVHAKRPDT